MTSNASGMVRLDHPVRYKTKEGFIVGQIYAMEHGKLCVQLMPDPETWDEAIDMMPAVVHARNFEEAESVITAYTKCAWCGMPRKFYGLDKPFIMEVK